ncbi:MAG: metal-dependent transcriptional regulator [Candidatus Electryonea clarkiae]|nr:metal-dependent transcriptional regulator [Candidatus Electryonea clarkiae]
MSPHRHNRKDLSSNMEDYLETIYLKDLEGNTAKVKNIADAMGVSKPSVTEALTVLQNRGLISHQKYGDIELTDRGRETASEIYFKHTLFFDFIRDVLAVPDDIAEDDACKVEHLVSDTTVNHMLEFMRFIEHQSKSNGKYSDFVSSFHNHLRKDGGEKSSS